MEQMIGAMDTAFLGVGEVELGDRYRWCPGMVVFMAARFCIGAQIPTTRQRAERRGKERVTVLSAPFQVGMAAAAFLLSHCRFLTN